MVRKLRNFSLFIITLLLFSGWCILPATAAAPTGTGVAVLVFHQITPGATNSVTMSPDDFTATLLSLKEQGYQFINLKTLHDYLANKVTLHEKSVLITFDDGYQDVYEYAHPILEKNKVPAVMFPIAMYYDADYRPPFGYIPHLSSEDTKSMYASGIWGFGGHSFDGHRSVLTSPGQYGPYYTSRIWLGNRQETEIEYQNRINKDVSIMVNVFKSMSIALTDFAPPTGANNAALQAVLTKNNLRLVYIQGNRLNYPGTNLIYRITASSPDQVLQDLNSLFPNTGSPNTGSPHNLKEFSSQIKQSIYQRTSFIRGGNIL